MTTFMIDPDNNITAFAHPQDADAAASGQSFASQEALDTLSESWPMDRFVTVWNSFAGVACGSRKLDLQALAYSIKRFSDPGNEPTPCCGNR
jgi:hypothetical protein